MKKSQIYEAFNVLLKQKNYLCQRQKSEVRFSSEIKPKKDTIDITKFSKLNLPLYVKGTLITPGTYRDSRFGKIVLTENALKESAEKWVGIDIFKQHGVYEAAFLEGRDVPIDMVVGKITKAYWNDKTKRLEYEGEIADEDIAFKIVKGLIRYVSVTFTQNKKPAAKGGYELKNITPLDLSLVFNPRDKNASIEPKNAS